MLEFLKVILGENYTEELDKKISEAVGKEFVPRTEFNAKNEAVKGLESQLQEANKTIEGFKDMDIEAIKQAAEDYKNQAEAAKKKAEKTIEGIRFNYALEDALRAAGCRDVISVKAHLKEDALKLDGDNILGLKEQLDTIKVEKDFLFESSDNTSIVRTGGQHKDPPTTGTLEDEISAKLFGK
ncbi:MAG: phage scaffolding protein [Bacillota bacterium]|nr:phage scaffolding protein [Bacillota bacterium]